MFLSLGSLTPLTHHNILIHDKLRTHLHVLYITISIQCTASCIYKLKTEYAELQGKSYSFLYSVVIFRIKNLVTDQNSEKKQSDKKYKGGEKAESRKKTEEEWK